MQNQITRNDIRDKAIHELTLEEMIFVHVSSSDTPFVTKNAYLRSTLSFAYRNVKRALANEHSKQIMPYITLCAILEQLGVCYSRKNVATPIYTNGIKKALVYFAELAENDELIDVIYALRNGLLHNISLTSFDKFKSKYYHFRFDKDIPGVFKKPDVEWDGDYQTLDRDRERYTTLINTDRFLSLVKDCIDKVGELNQQSLITLNLPSGVRQLYYDHIRSLPIDNLIE